MRLHSLRRIAVAAVFAWVGAVSAATVNVSSSASHVTVGSSVTLSFAVAGLHQGGVGSLAGFDLDLRYDNSLLQFQSFGFIDAASASNMLDLPEPAGLGFIGDATAAGGVVDAFGLSGNSTAVLDAQQADAFDFLTLTFIALQASSGTDFVVDLSDPALQFIDGNGLPINISFISARAQLVIDPQGGGNTVPEPAAPALALVALLGAAWARWQSTRAGRAALAVSLALAAPLSSHAQTKAETKAAEPTPIDVRVIEVAGTRAKVRADDGREYWVTVGPALTADKVGQRLRGQALPRGDAIKVNAPTFSAN
ncbi:MAG: cohesin domain-containing protein [Roseateles sp.]|uniref:cohesin domain-containing protein n=1 Tax=Roseateles sp. TaxID=1971397 RepID=UPI004037478C